MATKTSSLRCLPLQARWLFLPAQNKAVFCLQIIFLMQLRMSFAVNCLGFHLVIAANEL